MSFRPSKSKKTRAASPVPADKPAALPGAPLERGPRLDSDRLKVEAKEFTHEAVQLDLGVSVNVLKDEREELRSKDTTVVSGGVQLDLGVSVKQSVAERKAEEERCVACLEAGAVLCVLTHPDSVDVFIWGAEYVFPGDRGHYFSAIASPEHV